MNITPMFSAEAEFSTIGALLMDNDAIDLISDLKPEHFFVEDHRMIFTTIVSMIMAQKGCDVVTLAEELESRRDGENWLPILGEMVSNTPSSKSIGRYAKIVIDRATERSLLAASKEISDIASGSLPTDDKVDRSQALVMEISDRAAKNEGRHVSSIMIGVIDRIQKAFDGETIRRLTPWDRINRRADLLTPGDLIILAARPAMGKTSMAMNLAEWVSRDYPVVVFSQEMSGEQLGVRQMSSVGRVDYGMLLREQEKLTSEDFDRIAMATDKISKLKMFIDDNPARSLQQVHSYSRSIKRKHGPLGLIVIDYLQLMSGKEESRHEEIAAISRGLKVIAKELQVPVMALSQLNRGLESRPNKRPTMADLRESGQIEQDADVIMFIYRDEVYNPDTPDKGVAEIIFGKLREGQIGTDALAFLGNFSRFENLSYDWQERPDQQPQQGRGFK